MPTVTTATATALPATTWEPFSVQLREQRANCLRARELALAETATSHPDLVAVTRAATLLGRIDEIDAALARISAGTYGVCVHCGNDIPVERLEFRPHALSCVDCPRSSR